MLREQLLENECLDADNRASEEITCVSRELRDAVETFTSRMLCTGNPFEVLSTRGDSVADVRRHPAAYQRGGGTASPDEAGPGVAAPHGSELVWQMVSEAPDG